MNNFGSFGFVGKYLILNNNWDKAHRDVWNTMMGAKIQSVILPYIGWNDHQIIGNTGYYK
jgi:hypothetical protein